MSGEAEALCRAGDLLARRGHIHGSTGNLSLRLADGDILMTPTGSTLDRLDPARLSRLDAAGRHLDGDPPTKEWRLHLALYATRGSARAVVHTHSVHSVAVSLLSGTNPHNLFPPLTPYAVMRLGACALSPYRKPGDPRLADDIRARAERHHAIVLAHHGPVVAGPSMDDAVGMLEELEATARLYLLVSGHPHRLLSADEVDELVAP